jgi:hydroxymethylglutaryl-CoA lyase
MSDQPSKVHIREVGPREGFQFEKSPIPTSEKVRLIDTLSETGVSEIEVTSFVRPDRVPQMADADDVVERFLKKPDVRYTAIYLNVKGLLRAQASGKLMLRHALSLSASEAFSKRNNNCTIDQAIQDLRKRVMELKKFDINAVTLGVFAAFGCNFEGDIGEDRVLDLLGRLYDIASENEITVSGFRLLDTMGWANPIQIKRMIGALQDHYPKIPINIHLHDTRGMGVANAHAALDMGVTDFDTAVGGFGGCPFAGTPNAAGNLATEDFLLLCHELGIDTGIDIDAMIECARLAESIIGHPLPGKVKNSGTLEKFRKRAKEIGV